LAAGRQFAGDDQFFQEHICFSVWLTASRSNSLSVTVMERFPEFLQFAFQHFAGSVFG